MNEGNLIQNELTLEIFSSRISKVNLFCKYGLKMTPQMELGMLDIIPGSWTNHFAILYYQIRFSQ